MGSMTWIASAIVLVAAIIPPFGFRILPYYPSSLEENIAKLYDSFDSNPFFAQFTPNQDKTISNDFPTLSSFLSFISDNPLQIVNRGAHFQPHLIDALSNKSDKGNYFEGWYYKLVTSDHKVSVICIAGIFFDGSNINDHGFIMVGKVQRDQNGKLKSVNVTRTTFHISDVKVENFGGSEDRYIFQLGKNIFKDDYLKVDIPGVLVGELEFVNRLTYPRNFLNPNIMGFFAYLDATVGMQCVHNVVNLDAEIKGTLYIHEPLLNELDFSGGRVYVEGDYGNEFPDKYVWMSSNHFKSNPGSSVLLSLASVPLFNSKVKLTEIVGFLGFVYDKSNNKIYRFGTYTGAILKVEKNKFNNNELKGENKVSVEIQDAQYIYRITAVGSRDKAVLIWAPRRVMKKQENLKGAEFAMERYIEEMLDAQIQVIITRRSDKKTVFEGLGINGGLEIQIP